jgi:hypothetical protein
MFILECLSQEIPGKGKIVDGTPQPNGEACSGFSGSYLLLEQAEQPGIGYLFTSCKADTSKGITATLTENYQRRERARSGGGGQCSSTVDPSVQDTSAR